ncbi:MAG: PHP-associated domain-containing protein [Thermodesulfobacteriota bacterium]
MKLKADFHLHTGEDPREHCVDYSAKELIDKAAEKGFDCLSITNHTTITFSDSLKDYAFKKGIILIPGAEIRLNKKDIILLNFTPSEVEAIRTMEDILKAKGHNKLVIAPHPFFPSSNSLNSLFNKNIEVFDAIEFTSLYFRWINFNRKAKSMAKRFNLPLVGSSDTHYMRQLGSNYSLVDAKRKDVDSIIRAIKEHRIEVVTKPLDINLWNVKLALRFSFHFLSRKRTMFSP